MTETSGSTGLVVTTSSATHLVVTGRVRQRGMIADPLEALALDDPPVGEIVEALATIDGLVWLSGGEPTLRGDLPELIAAAAESRRGVGLVTDGLALARGAVVAPLVEAGLTRVRVILHAARADAHDWLVGRKGATRRAVRALATLREVGAPLAYELSAVITRPTMTHLPELVALAAELGASRLLLHRLRSDAASEHQVMLMPRFGLLEPHLEVAAQHARRSGVALSLVDFPRCVTGEATSCRREPEPRRVAASWSRARDRVAPERTAGGCAECLGPPSCRGAPVGYVARYGRDELGGDPVAPTTRLRVVAARARAAPAPEPASGAEWLRFSFGGPAKVACPRCGDHDRARDEPEPTRDIRRRLVRAARYARRVRIADAVSLSHPAAAAMLRECLLLFDEVAVAGEASALADMDPGSLYHLEGLSRVDAALYGPDAASHDAHVGRAGAFEATIAGLARLREAAGVPVAVYPVVHDPSDLMAFDAAWASGVIPDESAPATGPGLFFGEAPDPRVGPSGSDMRAMFEAIATHREPVSG